MDAGIDVSLESSSLCVVDATGRVVREAKIASEPEALTAWLKNRAVLGARKLLSLRSTLRGFGLKVGKTTQKTFESRVRGLVADHPTLLAVRDALLQARTVLVEQFKRLDKQAHRAARADKRARLLTTAPGVGSIVALTYASAIDDPGRFKSSKSVGPLFGLTPRQYQSGETDVTGRISKAGDAMVRTALYEAANVILDALGRGLASAKVGSGSCPARRDAQGQSGAGTQAGGDPAPDVGGWHPVRRCQGRCGGITEGGINRFGRPAGRPEQGPVAGTMDQAGRITCSGAAWLIGPEGPSVRKLTVRNENADDIPTISAARRRFCSGSGANCRFIACNDGMQYVLDAGLVIETPYCTQQMGGLTRGITLRAIQTIEARHFL